MAQKNRYGGKRQRRADTTRSDRRPALPPYEPKPPVQYGKPVVVMEDAMRNTFHFNGNQWVPFGMTIAECRRECLVKELPQKINKMTRYEVRCPMPS